MTTTTLAAEELAVLIERVLAAFTWDEASRSLAARWIVQAELMNLPSFGVNLLLRDIDALSSADDRAARSLAGVDGTDAQELASRAAVTLESGAVPGILALAQATLLAPNVAEQHGIASVSLRRVGGLGILGFAVRTLAERGLAGIALAHAPAIVAPWGGSAPAIGTNPIAVAFPRQDTTPLVLDFATSLLTMAELRRRAEAGQPLPQDAVLQRADEPSITLLTEGRIASLLGLTVELLAGVFTGSRTSASHRSGSAGRGAMLVALHPEHDITAATEQLVDDWRSAGGHVPARFDALASDSEALTGFVTMTSASLETLQERAILR